MKLAVTTTTPDIVAPFPFSLLEGDFSTRLKKAAKLGYDGIELAVLQPRQLDPALIHRQVEDLGLEVAAVASGAQSSQAKLTLLSPDPSVRKQARDRLVELICFAADVSAPLVTIGSFRGLIAAGDRQKAYADLVDILRSACAEAAAHSVRLAFEPLNRYETELVSNAAAGLSLINDVGHTHLGLLLDTFHMNIEEVSFRGSLQSAAQAGRLWHLHIADSNRLAPGQGHIPFDEIFTALNSLGYPGYCSAELLSLPAPDIAATQMIEYCRPYLCSF